LPKFHKKLVYGSVPPEADPVKGSGVPTVVVAGPAAAAVRAGHETMTGNESVAVAPHVSVTVSVTVKVLAFV
jgi:hypothetical protein